jgi:hypothetical protein
VGGVADGHRVRHLHGHLHPLLRHPHALVQPQLAKEPAFHRDSTQTRPVATAKGQIRKSLKHLKFTVMVVSYCTVHELPFPRLQVSSA